jgi:hypothetical protein
MLYEHNIANIIRQLIDVDGFIIQEGSTDGENLISTLIFNLEGYNFKINAAENPSSKIKLPPARSGTYLIARLDFQTLEGELRELKGDAQNGNGIECFEGLILEAQDSLESLNTPYLILYESKQAGVDSQDNPLYKWKNSVYQPSLNKFKLNSIAITGIDGKL